MLVYQNFLVYFLSDRHLASSIDLLLVKSLCTFVYFVVFLSCSISTFLETEMLTEVPATELQSDSATTRILMCLFVGTIICIFFNRYLKNTIAESDTYLTFFHVAQAGLKL